jgi:hypothetical protein
MKHFDDIAVWLFAILTVVAFNAAALTGLVCTRWLGHTFGLYAVLDNNTVGWVFSATLVIYAIAIGLIAVATWGNASTASAAASQEASHIVTLYRTMAGYPEPERSEFTRSIFPTRSLSSRSDGQHSGLARSTRKAPRFFERA